MIDLTFISPYHRSVIETYGNLTDRFIERTLPHYLLLKGQLTLKLSGEVTYRPNVTYSLEFI